MKDVIREKDASFGIIPLRYKNHSWQVFIIKSITGHWGFPKGHSEDQESMHEAAQRELKEETGLFVTQYLPVDGFVFSYDCRSHGRYVHKTVTLFLAQVLGDIHLSPVEVLDGEWINVDQIQEKVVFMPIQDLLVELQHTIRALPQDYKKLYN